MARSSGGAPLQDRAPTMHDVAVRAGVSAATVSRVFDGAKGVTPLLAERVRAAAADLGYEPNQPARPRQRQRTATMKDVAARAGVSTATVSRVLAGSARVEAGIAQRVRDAAAALRFRPNRAASVLAAGRSATVGLLVNALQNPFYLEVIRGVEAAVRDAGYLLVLCNSMDDPALERRYVELLCAESVAGAVVVLEDDRPATVQPFKECRIPVVAVDRRVRDGSVDAVVIDNAGATHLIASHLIANGYRRIGIITGPTRVMPHHERLLGYRRALQDAGLPNDPLLERPQMVNSRSLAFEESVRKRFDELLALDPPIDAIMADTNWITQALIKEVHARGLRIPEDLALAGFDELPWIAAGGPTITTIHQPAYELGRTAALRLVDRIRHGDDLPRQEVVLSYQFVAGDSTRPRRGATQS